MGQERDRDELEQRMRDTTATDDELVAFFGADLLNQMAAQAERVCCRNG